MFIKELEAFKKIIRDDDKRKMLTYFERAKDFRDSLKDRSRGAYLEYFDITVDIEDKPGSIAKVANILAECSINVKNINIPANREFEDGCLILSFSDEKTRIHALSVLNKNEIKAYKRG
jgi:prephenate dehydrogenase